MSERFMPKKPVMRPLAGDFQYRENVNAVTEHDFNKWWQAEIVPLFENAVEVYGLNCNGWSSFSQYHNEPQTNTPEQQGKTHRALLINIQPIKEETAEDMLREIVESSTKRLGMVDVEKIDKAKAWLEGRK